jgi:ADP-heptose:LPS heptosyltransferase
LKRNDPSTILPRLPKGAELLILRLRSLGDVVMLTPALAALHAWRPDLRLCVLVEPARAAILEGNPAVTEIFLLRGFLSAARELRRRRFSIVFNQHGGPTSALLTAAAGAPVRVCWAHRQFSFVYNVLVPDAAAAGVGRKLHTVEHRLTQFYWTGMPRGPIPPAKVYPQFDAMAAVRQKLAERGVAPGQPYAVLHPGAAFFTKRWSLEGFAETARWLRAEHGLATVFVLGPGDQEIASSLRQRLDSQSVLLDSLPLRELIGLLAPARLFVGNDSGPAHLAAAPGNPVVVIFGSSDSATWRPWQVAHRVVQNDFPCNPCRGDRCYAFDQPRCILSVTPNQVREACEALLAEPEAVGEPAAANIAGLKPATEN